MKCFMFPGQPLARAPRLPRDDQWRQIVALCRSHALFDPESGEWFAPNGTESVALQIYGVAMSLYGARLLKQSGVTPGIIAEHSMGIYPALSFCGSLTEEAALEITSRGGRAMARMGISRQYGLGCVVGLTLEPLLALAKNHGVYLANQNTDRHFLLSGEQGPMEAAMTEALLSGAFSARTFPCDAPLHTPLLGEMEGELREIFSDYRYGEPMIPLMSHIDQRCLSGNDLAEFMYQELLLPVRWEQSYRALRAAGANLFLEVGGGDSLKKYNRWIDSQSAGS
jgi:[acyl-carrier-protein] S-malonyltransferase